MPSFPTFTFAATVTAETGKQDKVELQIGEWQVATDDADDLQSLYYFLGAPQAASSRRTRIDLDDAHGWIFRTAVPADTVGRRRLRVRGEALRLENSQTGEVRSIPTPLFAGSCIWVTRHSAEGLVSSAVLELSINPTRFVRHQPVSRPLPEGLCERPILPAAPMSEFALHPADNWLPMSGRLLSYATPAEWRTQLRRYLGLLETAFESELSRACDNLPVPCNWQRNRSRYNLSYVETYWEWLSDDPLKVVCDLQPFFRNYTRRRRSERLYNVEMERQEEHDMTIFRAEISPGETLKMYAKTNRRIRFEVTHTLTGDHGFRFPGETDTQGNRRRTSRHVFESQSGVLNFLDRLRTRSAEIVNEFLIYCSERATYPVAHVSGYYLLACLTKAAPSFPTAISIASALINRGSLSVGVGNAEWAQTIRALVLQGVLERRARRKTYEVTEPFRYALLVLREQAAFQLLSFVIRERTR